METKEKKREKSAPSKKRPAAKSAVPARRAPARPGAKRRFLFKQYFLQGPRLHDGGLPGVA